MILQARSSVPALVVTLSIWFGSGGLANAACYAPDQQLPAQAVSDFLANSSQILQDPKNAAGGADMIALVRDLVASNPATLPLVIGLLSKANPAQQKAIGNGLGQAASKVCKGTDPVFAGEIPIQLARSDVKVAIDEYKVVTGDDPIRAVAGGGGVSGGSSGGSTGGGVGSIGGSSGFTLFSSNSTSNTPTNFFTGGAAGAGSAGTPGATATTSVSP